MNEIIANPAMHSVAARVRASAKYDSRIVAAFYDCLEPIAHDAWGEREQVIALPGPEEGFARVMLIGTTGSGKTTLLRQLIGSHPVRDRFPSTSSAKTTTADIEVIVIDGVYSSVVSFLPHEHVRLYVSECIGAAVTARLEHRSDAEVVRRFLEHSDQRFRLNYVLGPPSIPRREAVDDDLDDEDDENIAPNASEITDEQRKENAAYMQIYLDRIADLSRQVGKSEVQIANEFELDLVNISIQDREVIRDLAFSDLNQSGEFEELIDEIMDRIEERFGLVGRGEYIRGRDGWPLIWKFESNERDLFVRTINWFSSNYAPNFGRLLTPIVDGIRVRGPFRTALLEGLPAKYVLMDGQGVGHTADASSSISTTVTRRFKTADAIVLVDNAAQPMQAGSVAILRALVTSGHESKLCIGFTHFDDVHGPNLPSFHERRDHVMSSFVNATAFLGQQISREAERALLRLMPDRIVFLSKLDEELHLNTRPAREIRRLAGMFDQMILPAVPVELIPIYDVANLALVVERATRAFHQRWRTLLASEHWARIKALTRRIGVFHQDEYGELKPVADLINQLQALLHSFLACPTWQPSSNDNDRLDDKSKVTGAIRQAVSEKLYELIHQRMIDNKTKDWSAAYYLRGRGTTIERTRKIKDIYDLATPIPAETPDAQMAGYLSDLRALVAKAIKDHGGVIKGWQS